VPFEQVDAARNRSLPSQLAAAQTVPSPVGEQVPCFPATAHDRQLPQVAEPQQKPSVQ
jgi:hypothetical protein